MWSDLLASGLRERQAAELADAADEAGDGGELRETVGAHARRPGP